MDVAEAIETRRSFRALDPVEITRETISQLARSASLAPSCYNKQPWRFVFAYEQGALSELHQALSSGNAWAKDASLMVAVCSQKELDCVTAGREYYLFDTGMAAALMMLRAAELHLTTHPMAGFDEGKVKDVLHIPPEMTVIALIAVGKHAKEYKQRLSEGQLAAEEKRPPRLPLGQIAFMNRYAAQDSGD